VRGRVRYLGCALAAVLAFGVAIGRTSEPLPDAEALRHRLAASGLEITYRQGKPGDDDLTVLGGVAHGPRGGRVGFEFVFDEDGEPSTSDLGTIGFPTDFKPRGPEVLPVLRGVLRNVAYANYYLGRPSGESEDLAVTYRLDDALFGLFPPDDAEVHPILNEPPE